MQQTGKIGSVTRCLILVCCFVLLASGETFAKASIEKQTFVSNNKKRTFYLFVPDALATTEPVPLLLVFHGSGRNGLSLVEKWTDLATKERFIVAGLDSEDPSRWSTGPDNPSVVRDLVDFLTAKYKINSRRIYLFGHSGGAVYAIDLAMIESEYFAASAVHAGSWREREEFEILKNARRKVPVAIWVGTRDPFFSVESVRATRDALVANGFVAEVTEISGHDHWYYDLAPKINEAAWGFLKRYELPAAPHYNEFVEASNAADANKLIAEINLLQRQVMQILQKANWFEEQIGVQDAVKDRAEVQKLAHDEIEALSQAAGLARTAAQKAELAAQMKIGERNSAYMAATARYFAKFSELIAAQAAYADVLLKEPAETLSAKRTEVHKRVEELQQQVDLLADEVKKAAP